MACVDIYFTIYVTLVICAVALSNGDNLIVNTNLGKVKGTKVTSILPKEKYYSFFGIPYAQPPIGALRFMAPQPHEGWEGVLNCNKERNACAQYYVPQRNDKNTNYGFYGDEDCLTLSIHTPKLPVNEEANLPVIAFFLNDNFRNSYNVSKDYTPDFFMKEDVIIVTINHRLGSLGFLSFEDDLLPGNNGLRDVIMALKWLQENVHSFGGNPSRITLMGNHDGAVVVDILLHVPSAKGLFSGAILQSGTSWSSLFFVGQGRTRAKELASRLEVGSSTSSSLIKGLSVVPAMKLTEAELSSVHADESRKYQRGIIGFIPLVEHEHPDALITKQPEESSIKIDVPIMIGYNSREALEFNQRLLERPEYLTFADRDFLLLFPIRTKFHFQINDNVYHEAVREIKDFYFDEGYVKISKPGEYTTYIGDTISFYPIDYTVRKYVNASKAPVYYYTFDYSGEFNMNKKKIMEHASNFDGTWGASLGDELCYLFVCRPIKKLYIKELNDEEDSEDLKVLRNMVKLWTNFAKSGNPTTKGEDFTWRPATKENKDCLLINEGLEMKTNLHDDRVKFWDDFLSKHENKAIGGLIKDQKEEL